MAERREIKNREAPAAQADFNRTRNRVAQKNSARVIRPTMRQRLRTALDQAGRDARVLRNDAKDSAHSGVAHVQRHFY